MKFSKILLGIMMLILATSLVSAQEAVLFDDSATAGALAGLAVGLGIFMVLIFIAIYVYYAIALMTIAKKTKTELPWLAWIPIANVYLMTQIAGLNGLWTLAIFLPIIPIIGSIAFLAISIWWWWRIAEKRGFPGWISILFIIPLVNLVIIGVIAWGKGK